MAIRGFAFVPASLTVAPGRMVTWENCDEPGIDAHTSTSDEGLWDSPLLSPGEVFTRTFQEAGEFPYHCTPHPTLQGVVIVEP